MKMLPWLQCRQTKCHYLSLFVSLFELKVWECRPLSHSQSGQLTPVQCGRRSVSATNCVAQILNPHIYVCLPSSWKIWESEAGLQNVTAIWTTRDVHAWSTLRRGEGKRSATCLVQMPKLRRSSGARRYFDFVPLDSNSYLSNPRVGRLFRLVCKLNWGTIQKNMIK